MMDSLTMFHAELYRFKKKGIHLSKEPPAEVVKSGEII